MFVMALRALLSGDLSIRRFECCSGDLSSSFCGVGGEVVVVV